MTNWIRNIDVRWVAFILSGLAALAHGIISGELPLAHLAPGSWDDSIKAYCGLYLYIFPLIIGAHSATALPWKPATPGGFNAKAVIAFLIVSAAAFALMSHPAYAAVRHHRTVPAVPVPLSDPRPLFDVVNCIGSTNLPIGCKPNAAAPVATPAAATVKQNILATAPADIAYAIQLATQANTPQSNVRKMCYQAIGALIPTTPTGTMPPGPDVVTHIEQGAELLDGLQPNSPVFVNCAGAAALAGQNVLAFVNAVVTGIAGIAVVAPKLP